MIAQSVQWKLDHKKSPYWLGGVQAICGSSRGWGTYFLKKVFLLSPPPGTEEEDNDTVP